MLTSIRRSQDVVANFRSCGSGWRTRIGEVLRGGMQRHGSPARGKMLDAGVFTVSNRCLTGRMCLSIPFFKDLQ